MFNENEKIILMLLLEKELENFFKRWEEEEIQVFKDDCREFFNEYFDIYIKITGRKEVTSLTPYYSEKEMHRKHKIINIKTINID